MTVYPRPPGSPEGSPFDESLDARQRAPERQRRTARPFCDSLIPPLQNVSSRTSARMAGVGRGSRARLERQRVSDPHLPDEHPAWRRRRVLRLKLVNHELEAP